MEFSLNVTCWYGWQMLPGYTGTRCVPFFSPVCVRQVSPQKTDPPDYRGCDCDEWERDFAPVLTAGLALIRHLHQTTTYSSDDNS